MKDEGARMNQQASTEKSMQDERGRMNQHRWLLSSFILPPSSFGAIVCLLMAGCGGDGLERYPINGTVTFQGKPVEFGAIFFEPTASVGKIAPTVYLAVRDGKFDASDKGPIKGKYRVVVGGTDMSKKRVDDDGITHTSQLFKDYIFETDIPPPNNILHVEVPASQAIKRK